MLQSLSIKNYALIDSLELKPSAGLSMITGETGAGKSIMLGAVGLLLGNRADTKVLLHKDQKCIVEGIFEIGAYGLESFFKEAELDFEQTCIIRREISPAGKSRSFVNDTPVLLDTLKVLGFHLMDVHSQHDTLRLGDGAFQLSLVDSFSESKTLLNSYQTCFRNYKIAKKEFEELSQKALEMKKEADFNEFQLNELSALLLKAGEQEELETQLEVLEHSEEIKSKISQILGLLHEEQFGVLQGLEKINQGVSQIHSLAQKFATIHDRFKSVWIELNDLSDSLETESTGMEVDFDHLEELRDRLSKIFQLQKKHGLQTVEELMTLEAALADQVFLAQNIDDQIVQSKAELSLKEKELDSAAKKLTEKRKSGFPKFEKELAKLLIELGMPNAKVQISRSEIAPGPVGKDSIEFLFTANKGAEPQVLKKVASGGEFSRLLFAIKFIMADKMALPTLIFDEIDTGISGEVALQMVLMMQEIAKKHQVICITHLPQVAGKGETHFFVYKDDSSEKTISKIKKLTREERVKELAKMISGANPSDSAIESAKELLQD